MRFSSAETAFYEIAARAGGRGLRLAAILAVVISFGIANAMAAQAAVSRVLFAMARDRKLPGVLAAIQPRFQTPYVSTLLVAGISLLVGVFFERHIDDLTRVAGLGVILYVLYGMDRTAKVLGGCWIAAGIAYYFAQFLNARLRTDSASVPRS